MILFWIKNLRKIFRIQYVIYGLSNLFDSIYDLNVKFKNLKLLTVIEYEVTVGFE